MFLTKIRNRGGRSFLGKDVWFIKTQVEWDVSVEKPCEDFQLASGSADRTREVGVKSHALSFASMRLPYGQGGWRHSVLHSFLGQNLREWLFTKNEKEWPEIIGVSPEERGC